MMLAPGRLGRIGKLGFDAKPAPLPVTYSAEALALFTAWEAANPGHPTPASVGQKLITNDFIVAMKEAGIWPRLDIVHDFNVQGDLAALVEWKSPSLGTYDATVQGNPTFTPFLYGYQGNGVDAVLELNFTPSVDGVNYTQNAHSRGFKGTMSVQDAGVIVGTLPALNSYIYPRWTDDRAYALDIGGATDVANADASLVVSIDRSASNAWKFYIDGVSVSDSSGASLVSDQPLTLLAGYDGGVTYSTGGAGFHWAGGHFTPAEQLAFAGMIDAYAAAKDSADLIAYSGSSYGNDLHFGPALFVAADQQLSTNPRALHVLYGGVGPGSGKSSASQLAEWYSTIKPLFAKARGDKIFVMVPGDGDKADGSDGATTIAGMIANYQEIVDDAVSIGVKVVVSSTPSWAYASPYFTESTREHHVQLVAGVLGLNGITAACDISDDPLLYAVGAYLNTALFQAYPGDSIPHLNGAGYQRWGARLGAVVQSVRA